MIIILVVKCLNGEWLKLCGHESIHSMSRGNNQNNEIIRRPGRSIEQPQAATVQRQAVQPHGGAATGGAAAGGAATYAAA